MNRSLEALAIFTICLGGILAVVRFSAQDRSAQPRVAEQVAPSTPPAKNCCSEVELPTSLENCELAYAAGCGLDRSEGTVYTPCSPLLSPREVALRAIRSEPIPLVILPEELEFRTGYSQQSTDYDAAYDAAMNETLSSEEFSRAQLEAEYAAAELAAAELTAPSPTWDFLTRSAREWGMELSAGSAWLQRSYVDPLSRGAANRWSNSQLPQLLTYPRAKFEARQPLLHRKSAQSSLRVSWDDYLACVERRLVQQQAGEDRADRVARQKPRNVLWPR